METKNLLTVFKSACEVVKHLPSRTISNRRTTMINRWIALIVIISTLFLGVSSAEDASSLKGVVGSSIAIPCTEKSSECNDIHTVRWYHNGDRIFVYIAISGSSLSEKSGQYEFRANDTPPALHISSVKLTDEGTYRCDVTYLNLKPECPTSKSSHLKTIARPNPPEIYLELPDGEVIGGSGSPVTGTTIGPFHEEELITLTCSSSGGKPSAQVSWWNGSQSLGGIFTEEIESDGTGVGTNELRMKISRSDLLARYDCQVMHETLDGSALVTWIEVDVHVPPSSLVLEGETKVDDGEEISLKCTSKGARPAARITWYNGTEVVDSQPDVSRQAEEDGKTFQSTSILTFISSRYDDEETFHCESSNEALVADRGESPLRQQTTLTVFYAPVVSLSSPGFADHSVEVNEGATLRLDCAFEANPAVNVTDVTWFRNGHTFRKSTSEDDEKTREEDAGETGSDKENGKQESDNVDDKDGSFHLVLTEINRRHSGEYSCSVTNNVGTGASENNVNVSILYAPEVRLLVSPTTAIEHVTNVSLSCEVKDANPLHVKRVRWFRDSQLIGESEEPLKVLIEVARSDHSNYSCQAENQVGWGQVAEPVLLDVTYTPGRARITHRPPLIIKGQPVTIMCEFDDLGNPPATEFVWKRGEFWVSAIRTANWSMPSADLTTQNEYSCNTQNAAGEGIGASAKIDVNAAPSLINGLLPSTGALETAKDISLSCQVECEPRCSIDWFKNGELLTVDRFKNGDVMEEETMEEEEEDVGEVNRNGAQDNEEEEEDLQSPYSVKVSYLQPNFKDMYFSSVVSTLRWNVSAWTNKRLDRILDGANYTCRSSPNLAGIGVNSTTSFQVEYPPENISLTNYEIEIEEGQILPSPITCKADGKPKLTYLWTFDGKPVSGTSELKLNFQSTRERSGVFTCIASNTHGNLTAKVTLDVQYKPECKLHASVEEDGSTLLTCEVTANPDDVDFVWLANNETVRDKINTRGLVSRLNVVGGGGKYHCIVNNSVGHVKEACVIELQGPEGALIAGFADNRIIIIIVVVAAIIIISIIVCIVVFLVMKRRGTTGKLSKTPRNQPGPPGEGDKAFYENLPFHGLQPAPNKPFKPLLPDLEYADVDFTSANQGQQPPIVEEEIEDEQPPPLPLKMMSQDDVIDEEVPTSPPEEEHTEEPEEPSSPSEEQQQLLPLQPERPPRANKIVLNNNHHA